jgi:arylsulfatase A
MDLFPTCLKLAGAELPADRDIDGKDLLPLLLGRGKGQREVIYYYIDSDLTAIRKGPWKAHFITQIEFGNRVRDLHDPPLLFNLEQDPSEKYNMASEYAEIVADLIKEAERHRRSVKPGKPQT